MFDIVYTVLLLKKLLAIVSIPPNLSPFWLLTTTQNRTPLLKFYQTFSFRKMLKIPAISTVVHLCFTTFKS